MRIQCYDVTVYLRILPALLLLTASLALAQPYRWTDDKGRVHFSDTPPASVKAGRPAAQRESAPAAAAVPAAPAEQPVPFEVLNAQKDFPVTLYSAPICKKPCELARDVLNQRGIPFNEIQIWDADGLEKLKALTNSDNVPALTVGRTAITGFDPARYDGLLDSAGYPKRGAVPSRAQKAPAPPVGYEPLPTAEAAKPEQDTTVKQKSGPYDSSGLVDPSAKPQKKLYDPSGLQGPPPKPGGYKLPGSDG